MDRKMGGRWIGRYIDLTIYVLSTELPERYMHWGHC